MDRASDAVSTARGAAEMGRTAGDFVRMDRANDAALAQTAGGYALGELGSGSFGVDDYAAIPLFSGGRPGPAAQEMFRQSEREYRRATEESIAGVSYRAQAGDSISRIVGSSAPQAIGNFMRANGLASDQIEVGRNYFRPDSATSYGDSSLLGQFALNRSNERIAVQRAAAALARNALVTDDITLGDLNVLNAAFARREGSAAFARSFVGPLQPPTSYGEIKASPDMSLGRQLAGAVIGEPIAFAKQLAGGLPVNPITNALMNFEGSDRKLLAMLGVAPLPFAKAGQGMQLVERSSAALTRELATDLALMPPPAKGVIQRAFDSVVHGDSNYVATRWGDLNLNEYQSVRAYIGRTEAGQKVLAAADNRDIFLRFTREAPPVPGLLGITRGNSATTYLTKTEGGHLYELVDARASGLEFTSNVGLHEGLHALGVRSSRRAEALVRLEELRSMGVPIDRTAMRQVLTDMGSSYSKLPWRAGQESPYFPGLRF